MPADSIDQLCALVADLEPEDNYFAYFATPLRCRSAVMDQEQLSLTIDILVGGSIHSRWTLVCEGVIEHRITLGSYDWIAVHDDHPLLYEYVQPRADLYFTKAASNPYETAGKLRGAHEQVLGDWRPIHQYTNSGVELARLLSEPSGQLAGGPRNVIDAYAAALTPLPTTVLSVGNPKRWDAHRGVFVDIPEVRLLVLSYDEEPTFAVAERFSARRLPDGELGDPSL